jgi:hypothetical protein
LERELVSLDAQLRAPSGGSTPELDDNPGPLAWLPHTEIDLTRLATARLRKFLDAFRVEIHYEVRTGRATFPCDDQRRIDRSTGAADPPNLKSRARAPISLNRG